MRRPTKAVTEDVRMRGFTRRHTVRQALEWLDVQLTPLEAETVPLGVASGRVVASAVISDVDVPGFDRSTMDGYAVVAAGTEGAGAYNRVSLTVIGDSMPGRPFEGAIRLGERARSMDDCGDLLKRRHSSAAAHTRGAIASHVHLSRNAL